MTQHKQMASDFSATRPLLIVVALFLSGCSHTPLRPFDCQAILGLRLGQSPDEVRTLLGKPVEESAEQKLWESKQVVDYVMRFEDQKTAWITGSSDVFWVEFLSNKLVRTIAFRVDNSEAYAENGRSRLQKGSRPPGILSFGTEESAKAKSLSNSLRFSCSIPTG